MNPSRTKYALVVGKDTYVLSDQQTPEKFAAQKVMVSGSLFEKTKFLKVDKIEAVSSMDIALKTHELRERLWRLRMGGSR